MFSAYPQRLDRGRLGVGAIVGAGAVCVAYSIADLVFNSVGPTWFVLVGLTFVTAWATIRMPVTPVSFSVSDTFTMTAAVLFGPSAGAAIVMLDGIVISLRLRENGGLARGVFNATAPPLAMWLAAQLFFALARTGPLANHPSTIRDVTAPLAIFALSYFFLNTGFVAIAVAADKGGRAFRIWREHLAALWLTYFGGASIAALLTLMLAAQFTDLKTLTLVLPLVLVLYLAFRISVDRVRDHLVHLSEIKTYAAALRSTADAVIMSDAGGRISFINPTAARLTGWDATRARGCRVDEVFQVLADGDRGDFSPTDAPIDGDVRELVLVRADGGRCAVEATCAEIRDERGATVGVIRTFRDVTLRKAFEREREALLQREREARAAADAANRVKDEFLATVSHELSTPATGILGWTRMLRSGRLDPPQTERALNALERGARAQAAVLKDLLDMSRIARGVMRLELQTVDVMVPLREAIDTVEPALSSKHMQLRIDAQPELPPIDGDPDRLRQVFWNLLSNAVKFTGPGGRILVSVAAEPDAIRIDVADNGPGISSSFLPFVFDGFRQADSSSTRAHTGLGLGLAIVRHLVESHGGSVSAASDGEGAGARFTVRLPVAAAERGREAIRLAI